MYQESISPKTGKLSNIAVIITAVLAIFVLEPTAVWVNTKVPVVMMVFQAAVIIVAVAFCIWFYRKRLRGVKYVFLTTDSESFGALEERPDNFKELEEGTFLAESVVGAGTGTYIAVVQKSEMKAFYGRGECFRLPKKTKELNACLCRREEAAALLFEQEGKSFAVYIEPSEKLEKALRECIA